MKEEVRQKVMERFSISEQAMRLLLESAEMMSFVPRDKHEYVYLIQGNLAGLYI